MHPVEIPDFLSHLSVYGGLPVPFSQAWVDGKPDFRATDPEKVIQCVTRKLCAICGKRLGEYAYFIGGPLSEANRLFSDPAMHQQCAEFASKACPFVSGQTDYSTRLIDESKVAVQAAVSAERPTTMFILKSRTKDMRLTKIRGSLAIEAGRWLNERLL